MTEMHSHYGSMNTHDLGFRIWKWSILLIGVYLSSWVISTPSLSHPCLQLFLLVPSAATTMVYAVARAAARKATNAITHGGHNGPGQSVAYRLNGGAQLRHASTTTSTPHGLGPCPPRPIRSPPHRLFSHSRNFLTYIFNQLTAPGIRFPTYIHNGGTGASRSLHSGAAPTIKSGLSFHARTALSSGPRHNIFLPRPPSPGVRVATNVGLGTARNFSTARPIFQNLVDNVPVVARALYEADLDLRRGHTRRARLRRAKKSAHGKRKEMIKPRDTAIVDAHPQVNPEDEIAHYFNDTVAPVTTYLFIPLAPTPSSRVPLPIEPIILSGSHHILPPLSLFSSYHASHGVHAARVSSLFLRLDQAGVWEKGVKCSAYGQGHDGAGVCTLLKVEFVGWTEMEVRALIGEGGTGWCALEEVRFDGVDDMSEFSSVVDSAEVEFSGAKSTYMEPSASFIMPTLDLSSSALDPSLPSSPSMRSVSLPSSRFSSRPLSPIQNDIATPMIDDYDDPWSDGEADTRVEAGGSAMGPPSESGWSQTGSERSWQNLGALEFSAQHLNQWD